MTLVMFEQLRGVFPELLRRDAHGRPMVITPDGRTFATLHEPEFTEGFTTMVNAAILKETLQVKEALLQLHQVLKGQTEGLAVVLVAPVGEGGTSTMRVKNNLSRSLLLHALVDLYRTFPEEMVTALVMFTDSHNNFSEAERFVEALEETQLRWIKPFGSKATN